jgi:hypothetical protein
MKPNIFDIATKELSQDAFFTWIFNWAHPNNKEFDVNLHNCGKEFVLDLLKSEIPNFDEEITNVFAKRQFKKIDISITINDKYFIIIEDKTNTGEHSEQLRRYKEDAISHCEQNNLESPICIYLKTGNESKSSLTQVEKFGYFIYDREKIINLLKRHKEINNQIFVDFRERILRIEKFNNFFLKKVINSWNNTDWEGLYQCLENENIVLDWRYVSNPAGGFLNAWITPWVYWKNKYPLYLQIEQGNLCFKISTHPGDIGIIPENITRKMIRDEIHNLLITKSKDFGLNHIVKPARFGAGNWMTVAIVKTDCWLGAGNSIIDIEKVFEELNKYKKFLEEFINNSNSL